MKKVVVNFIWILGIWGCTSPEESPGKSLPPGEPVSQVEPVQVIVKDPQFNAEFFRQGDVRKVEITLLPGSNIVFEENATPEISFDPDPGISVSNLTRVNGTTLQGDISVTSTAQVGISKVNIKNGPINFIGQIQVKLGGCEREIPHASDLVAYWGMNEGEGTLVRDITGRGNDGTVFKDLFPDIKAPEGDSVPYNAAWTDGKFDKAIQFDGQSIYVGAGGEGGLHSLSIDYDLTFSAWIKPKMSEKKGIYQIFAHNGFVIQGIHTDANNNNYRLFGGSLWFSSLLDTSALPSPLTENGDTPSTKPRWIVPRGSIGKFAGLDSATGQPEKQMPIDDGGWHHVAFVWNRSLPQPEIAFYFDGRKEKVIQADEEVVNKAWTVPTGQADTRDRKEWNDLKTNPIMNGSQVLLSALKLSDLKDRRTILAAGGGDKAIALIGRIYTDNPAKNADGSNGNGPWFFKGLIDEVGVWKHAFSSQEISDHKNKLFCSN